MSSHPASIPVTVAAEIADLVRLAHVGAAPVQVGPAREPLRQEIERVRAALAREHAGKAPAAIPGLAPARDLYRSFGIDPTRTRPSSEALLRRVLKGKELPCISSAVDLCTLLSLEFLLPLGLYDADSVRGNVTLRRGGPGESYAGIRKDAVHVEGRLVLEDEEGPFGNPTSDSLRTSVHAGTRSLWLVVFAPPSLSRETLAAHVDAARQAMAFHLAPEGESVVTTGGLIHPSSGTADEATSTP